MHHRIGWRSTLLPEPRGLPTLLETEDMLNGELRRLISLLTPIRLVCKPHRAFILDIAILISANMKDQSKKAKYVVPRPRNLYNFFVALFVAFGSLCYGYASSISAALIGQPSWYEYMGLEAGSAHSQRILGAINGVYAAGGVFGCIFNMWSCEALGRKKSIQLGCLISIVGASLMTGTVDIPMFIASRFIMGFGIGILVTLVPLYQSEVSPAESRGLMVGLHGVLIGFSYSLTGFVTYGCYFAPYGQFQWRFPLSVQLIPCIILFAGSFLLPESPRWLIGKDQTDLAWEITRKLHRNEKDPEDTYAHAEFAQMMAQINFERQHNAVGTIAQAHLAFSQRSFLKRLGLGFLVQFGNQCTGMFSPLCISCPTPCVELWMASQAVFVILLRYLTKSRRSCHQQLQCPALLRPRHQRRHPPAPPRLFQPRHCPGKLDEWPLRRPFWPTAFCSHWLHWHFGVSVR